MEKITLEDFLKLVETDASLRDRLRACGDPQAAINAVTAMASEQGYELIPVEFPEKEALSDDALDAVSGGVNPFIPRGEGELNPYSWFVTLLRRLMGMDSDPLAQPSPDQPSEDRGRQ